jgi:hypothetical protein
MSVTSHTVHTVRCDGPSCPSQGRTDVFEVGTATQLRKILKKRGWLVNCPDDETGRRKDYCPRHRPDRRRVPLNRTRARQPQTR